MTAATSGRRVAVVTGGSRGIGAATARLAASRGYAVCLNYRANAGAADAVVNVGTAPTVHSAVAAPMIANLRTVPIRNSEGPTRHLSGLATS